jgi:hypothetical protein
MALIPRPGGAALAPQSYPSLRRPKVSLPPATNYDMARQSYYGCHSFQNGTYCFIYFDGTIVDANGNTIDADIDDLHPNGSFQDRWGDMQWIPAKLSALPQPIEEETTTSFVRYTVGNEPVSLEWYVNELLCCSKALTRLGQVTCRSELQTILVN